MSTEIKIHDAQMSIVRALLFTPQAGFAQLQKPTGLDSDHFKFHIAKLVELDLVEKLSKGLYKLSQKGKEFANKLDTESNTVERQPKVSVIINGWRKRPGTDTDEFLVQQRLKNPYYGYWARIGGKVRWGETILDAAARELLEETGMIADLELKEIYHKMDYSKETGDMLEDKVFFMIRAQNLTGTLIENFEGGRNAWMTLSEIQQQPKKFSGVADPPDSYMHEGLTFVERRFDYDSDDY